MDPGAGGALALLDHGGLSVVTDMPVLRVKRGKSDKAEVDGYSLANVIKALRPDVAFVELVGGVTGQSASASFNFGRATGAVEYSLKALGVRVELVAPVTWKRALKVNGGKDGSRAMAMRFWPSRAELFERVKDDGRAEASLIAEWGRRQLGGKTDVFG